MLWPSFQNSQKKTFPFTKLYLLPDSSICRNAGDACPVRRGFGDLAFPQGEELIPHIDVLRRILLSSPGGNRTASSPSWMMALGCPHDGFLLFLLYPFQSPLSVLPEIPGMPAYCLYSITAITFPPFKMQATSFPSSISLCLIKQIGRQNFYFRC